eukprot:g13504.t2
MARKFCTAVVVLLSAARAAAAVAEDAPSPPIWPGRFHAMMSHVIKQNYGVVDLWYDYAAGRNLNVIQTQGGEEDGPLFDNERANGTTYYYYPAKAKAKYCNPVDFGVGIIKPDWLKGATYLGEEECGIYQCHKWEQGEIPEAHARFLGLRDDGVEAFTAVKKKRQEAEASSRQAKERALCHKWEQGEIPEAHARFLGLRDDGVEAFTAVKKKRQEAEASSRQAKERALYAAGGLSPSLRGGDEAEEGEGEGEGEGHGDRFITYWTEKGTGRPVKWVFFNDAYFQVIRFDEGATMPDDMFQIPSYCFEDKDKGE